MRAAPFGLLAAMLAAAGISATAEAAPRRRRALHEPGCSSCPPADELLAKLARDPDVIALSLPVDYWDRLGWKDTLARRAFTERQTVYASVRGDGQVYTPQAIVNGREHAVGSERSAIERAAAATAAGLTVPLDVESERDGIVVSIGAAPAGAAAHATVVLLPFYASREVAIGRGENANAKVTYTNVVRDIVAIADWNGEAMQRAVPRETLKGYDGVVVLLQEGSVGKPAPFSAPRASPCVKTLPEFRAVVRVNLSGLRCGFAVRARKPE
jgi:hypothetical protein